MLIQSASSAATLLEVYGDGGIIVGNPTGGDKGAGSLNMQSCYVNGVACNLPTVSTATSATSVTPNCTYPIVKVTASATGTFTVNAPGTCTPVDGQQLILKVISPSGGTVTYSWNATYVASATLALPTTSNAASKEDYFSFRYDADKSNWVFLADNQGF